MARWHGRCFRPLAMTLRTFLAASLLAAAASPALAQPAPVKAPVPAATPDDMANFDKELDALFTPGGLTSEQAAQKAVHVSPAVARAAAEIEVSIATAEAAELTRVPPVSAKAAYTRLSSIDPPILLGGFEFPIFLTSYTVQGSIGVPLSDYV